GIKKRVFPVLEKREKMRQKYAEDKKEVSDEETEQKRDKEKERKEKEMKDIYTIFQYWNSKKIIKHKRLNERMEYNIKASLKDYNTDELMRAIDNYSEVLTNDLYFWSYKWTLQDFLNSNNVSRFLDEAEPLKTFIDKGKQRIQNEQVDMKGNSADINKILEDLGDE
ncbi:MAG: hypothetical protein AB2421_08315, partial [Thermotaleaceae bacterium]